MKVLHFTCPDCKYNFRIKGYWKWILTSPFHFFSKRYTKCPCCEKRFWMTWHTIIKIDENDCPFA